MEWENSVFFFLMLSVCKTRRSSQSDCTFNGNLHLSECKSFYFCDFDSFCMHCLNVFQRSVTPMIMFNG